MSVATFENPDGDDVEVDADEVVSIRRGEEEGTVIIELDDGSEVTVVASELEAAAELGLDPLDVTPADDGDGDELDD